MEVKGEPVVQSSSIISQDSPTQSSRQQKPFDESTTNSLNDHDQLGDRNPLLPNGDGSTNDIQSREPIDPPSISGAENYRGFQKMTTIPAASLSILVSFVMIASVCKFFSNLTFHFLQNGFKGLSFTTVRLAVNPNQ